MSEQDFLEEHDAFEKPKDFLVKIREDSPIDKGLAKKFGINGFTVDWFTLKRGKKANYIQEYLTPAQINLCTQELTAYISAGYIRQDIMHFMKINEDDYVYLYKIMLVKQRQLMENSDKYENFLKYKFFMERCIEELDFIVRTKETAKGGELTAKVNAVRAKAEIYDKIISKGEQLGVIRTSDGAVEDADLSKLDNKQLANLLKKEVIRLNNLINQKNIAIEFTEEEILESDLPFAEKEKILDIDDLDKYVDDEYNDAMLRDKPSAIEEEPIPEEDVTIDETPFMPTNTPKPKSSKVTRTRKRTYKISKN